MNPDAGIVVVGCSLAGVRSAEAVLDEGYRGRLVMVGGEAEFPPVDRPSLSKTFLRNFADPAKTIRVSDDLIDRAEILVSRYATGLDLGRSSVRLEDGTLLPYRGLVIATGARARVLDEVDGADNVYTLRTGDDASGLRRALNGCEKIAILGGGVLGCEVSASVRYRGVDVYLIDRAEYPLSNSVGPACGRIIEEMHRSHGVKTRFGQQSRPLMEGNRVVAIELGNGEVIGCDLLVVAIGAAPSDEWLTESGLRIDNGVLCDDMGFAEGGSRSVVAVGDVSRWAYKRYRDYLRFEHWTNAIFQARVAGRNLIHSLSGLECFARDGLPYFWSDQFDWRIQSIGIPGDKWQVEYGSTVGSKYVFSGWRDGTLCGAVLVNAVDMLNVWRARILEQAGDRRGVGP